MSEGANLPLKYQDTPFDRQNVLLMTHDQLTAHVIKMRERRMSAHKLYEEAKAAKAKLKEEGDIKTYEKRLEQIKKKLDTVDKAMEAVDKWMAEVSVIRLSIGDTPWQQ